MFLAAYDTFNLLLPKMTLLPKIICYSNGVGPKHADDADGADDAGDAYT